MDESRVLRIFGLDHTAPSVDWTGGAGPKFSP